LHKKKHKEELKQTWAEHGDWKRISEIWKGETITVVDRVGPWDVKQGQLGN